MNCPKCNGEGKRIESIKEGNTSYGRNICLECGQTFFSKTEETECLREDFMIRQRKKEREKAKKKYHRKLMKVFQVS